MPKNSRSASFDLTHFGTPKKFRALLKANKMRFLGAYHRRLGKGKSYIIYQWGNKDVLMGTLNNALTGVYGAKTIRRPVEKGYASSIGIKGKPEAVAKLVRTIKKKALWYKDYDPRHLQFIGVGTRKKKKRRK